MIFSPALAIACLIALSWLLWVTGGLMLVLYVREYLLPTGNMTDTTHLIYGAAIFVALGFGARFMAGAVKRLMDKG
jgi:hypothetical protein